MERFPPLRGPVVSRTPEFRELNGTGTPPWEGSSPRPWGSPGWLQAGPLPLPAALPREDPFSPGGREPAPVSVLMRLHPVRTHTLHTHVHTQTLPHSDTHPDTHTQTHTVTGTSIHRPPPPLTCEHAHSPERTRSFWARHSPCPLDSVTAASPKAAETTSGRPPADRSRPQHQPLLRLTGRPHTLTPEGWHRGALAGGAGHKGGPSGTGFAPLGKTPHRAPGPFL